MRSLACYVGISYIMLVTAYDIYCTVKLADTMYHCEENPVAKLLINEVAHEIFYSTEVNRSDSVFFVTYDVSNLVVTKVIGSMLALVFLLKLVESSHTRIAALVVSGLVVLQSSLLMYLVS
jgi:hypothetical protein